jgi:hypothetical protein
MRSLTRVLVHCSMFYWLPMHNTRAPPPLMIEPSRRRPPLAMPLPDSQRARAWRMQRPSTMTSGSGRPSRMYSRGPVPGGLGRSHGGAERVMLRCSTGSPSSPFDGPSERHRPENNWRPRTIGRQGEVAREAKQGEARNHSDTTRRPHLNVALEAASGQRAPEDPMASIG